ncbi:AraC family transcriptional regulator [Flavobacterium sp. C4GT6]|uniref:AraC family transcriptional regulator n=1 Tax=Flavobacterium sp. C4GT6 TaxID=3103818 RepID=UPI002ED4679F
MKPPYLFLFLLFPFFAKAQTNSKIPDSLSKKSYDELTDCIDNHDLDSTTINLFITAYIEKSKRESDTLNLISGYRSLLNRKPQTLALKYADTIFKLANTLKEDEEIGHAYLDRAVIYYISKNYQKSLDNYLEADKYINETNDPYTQYKIKYGIANIKYYLGNYQEALELFTSCKDFYKKREGRNNKLGYLHTLCSTGQSYFKLGQYEKCSETNRAGVKDSKDPVYKVIHNYFLQSEGINQFAKQNYNEAIKYLLKSLPEVTNNNDFVNIAINDMYLGKSHIKLNQEETGINYLQRVDSILQKHHYANLDLRETYELFINYYKKKNDLENQLKYTNRLLEADRILEKNYKDLIHTIHKEYDTAELVASKNNLEKILKQNKVISYSIYGVGSIIILVITFMLVANYKKQKTYRLKYNELIAKTKEYENQPELPTTVPKVTLEDLDINKEIISKILKGLGEFEKKKNYLNSGITQSALAEELETNTTYLSKVINHYKEKNFNSYLNELRVNHAVLLLKNSPTHRRYTIKALAEELGFSNPRSFSDAFFSQTGIKPSYFIKQVEKEQGLQPEE